MIVIDGTSYDIPVVELSRKADVLDKFAERTEDGVLHREIIGVYFNYTLKFGSPVTSAQRTVYQALWAKLTEATEFHTVTVPDEDGDFTFTAYFSNVGDTLRKIKPSVNYWKDLTVNFIAQSPART
jgi:hypothetical protein